MELSVDFQKSTIKGVAIHSMKVGALDQSAKAESVSQVVLDVQGMEV